MGNYKELKVWQQAIDLSTKVYKITGQGKFERDFRFRDQIRSSSVSIPSNIAEGDELDTIKQGLRHFYIARGSLAELQTQLIIAKNIGYLEEDYFSTLEELTRDLSVRLQNFISYRNKLLKS